jgi:AcrR family transcriptional regulator
VLRVPPVSERYRESRRRQVLDAARRCFARAGFHGTSMQDIFVESGLSAGAVYGYFPSKQALVRAIIEEVTAEVGAALNALASAEQVPPPHVVVGRILDALDPPQHGQQLARLAVQVWAEAGGDSELATHLAGRYRDMRERFATLVRRYQGIGALPSNVDADDIAQVLTALGPAFLTQRALLDDASATTFTRGVRGLLCEHADERPAAGRGANSRASHR